MPITEFADTNFTNQFQTHSMKVNTPLNEDKANKNDVLLNHIEIQVTRNNLEPERHVLSSYL